MNVFNFDDYRDLISCCLEARYGRGSKLKLAQELNCQPGYISQVLGKSKIHFSPESTLKTAHFLKLTPQESEFLLTLLALERAGSKDLRDFYTKKIRSYRSENLTVEKQVKEINHELDETSKAIYYSHWAYSAIHMLVSIDHFQTESEIAKKLRLNSNFVEKVLDFLFENHLIEKKGSRYSLGRMRVHLKKDSPLVKVHHQNYRQKAILTLEEENDFDLHYSSVLTLSKKDALKIRSLILKLISDKEEILIPSTNEDIIGFNIDLFKF